MIFITDEIKGYDELIRITLSKKRYTHSVNVADMCFRLATINGFDSIRAYTAGILHDIKKEDAPVSVKKLVVLSNLNVDRIELETPALWHSIAGAAFVRDTLKVDDADIINAIRYHTVGRANMSMLEKIVYLGDLISADRTYKDVERFRKLAVENLDNAMFEAIKWSIEDTMEKGCKIPPSTFEAYNYYMDFSFENERKNKQ